MWHALTQDKDVPPESESASKKKTDWGEVKKYVDYRKAHDALARDAFGPAGHPYHFEELMRFGSHLFDQPPKREEAPAEDLKNREKAGAEMFVAGLREQVARQAERVHRD